MTIWAWSRQGGHTVTGPILRRASFPRAVREALHLRADTFAFIAKPGSKPAEVRQGRELWAERGGMPPLAIVPWRDDAQWTSVVAGLQMAVAAGAGAAMLELPAAPVHGEPHRAGMPVGRHVLEAAAKRAAGLPLLYSLTPDDLADTGLIAWLRDHGAGWCLDPGLLFAHGWWEPQQLTATGWALQRAGLPGAIVVREPQTPAPEAGQSPLGLGAMGLNLWWDVFSQPWTAGVPVYVEIPGRGAGAGAELHSVRRLLEVARAG